MTNQPDCPPPPPPPMEMETVSEEHFAEADERNGADDIMAANPSSPGKALNAPGVTSADLDAVGDRLSVGLAQLQQRMKQLEQVVELKVSREEHLNQIIDQLHRELQDHRLGMLRKQLEPMAIDLITACDDFGAMAEREQAKTDDPTAAARATLAAQVRDELHEILNRYGFDRFIVPDDKFDATRQRAVRFESTAKPEYEGLVASRRRCGFLYNGQVVRPEQVIIYRFVPPAAPEIDVTTAAQAVEAPASN